MKRLHIFKTGTHTDSAGKTLDFNEGLLSAAAQVYDPQLSEAPIVVGHPASNLPAYGWIKSLSFSEAGIHAEPHQVNPEFAEMVKAGSFKKISASWYLPDSPHNPAPGSLYLRHVGFLGAQPPAIKGLQTPEFNESAEGVVSFEDNFEDAANLKTLSVFLRNIQKFIIDKFSSEDAERVVPDYMIDELSRSADRKVSPPTNPMFNENEDPPMDLEQLQAENTALKQQIEDANTESAALKAKLTSFEESAKAMAKAQLVAKIDELIAAGHALPAQKNKLVAFCEMLEGSDKPVEFGEGDNKVELTGPDAFIEFLKQNKAIDFSQQSEDHDQDVPALSASEVARKAVAYQEEQKKAGISISIVDAVNHINQKQD